MKKLTEKEEAIMAIFWEADRAFAKDVRAALPASKPHIIPKPEWFSFAAPSGWDN
ncbi:MAG: BlaI/MecI/CopY family transcriptional regulator [Lewinella sp.]